MKRILSILLVLLLSLSVLTGCAQLEALAGKLPFDIPFLGEKECTHDYDVVVTAPTCEAAGFTTKTCKLCQNVETVDPTEALGHNYVNGVCSVCKAEDPNYVPPHEHNYTSVVTAPTCEAAGYTTYTCDCGDSYVADQVAALGHTFADGVCGVCGAEDPNYVLQDGTYDAPYIITAPGDYVAAFPGESDLVFYKMTNNKNGGYYTISSTKGEGVWFKIGTDIYNLESNNGTGESLTVYVPAGVTCYFSVADWNEVACDIPFTVSFEAFVSEPVDQFVGSWSGVHTEWYGDTQYILNIDESGLGTIVEKTARSTYTYSITLVVVKGNNVSIRSVDEYGNAFNLELTYDAAANSLTGGNNFVRLVLTPYDPSEEPDAPAVDYNTVLVIGSNTLYFSADEIAADTAIRTLLITVAGNYKLSSGNLFVDSVTDADGNVLAKNDDFSYTLAEGEYTLTFGMLAMFGVAADAACDLVVEEPADIGGGDGGEDGGEDDEPTYIEPYDELKDSLYGFYTFDGYKVFLFYNSTVGIYYANVYGEGYDLYFTYEVTVIEEGVYALTLTATEHESNSGLEYVDTVLGFEIVIEIEIPVDPSQCEHNYEIPYYHPDMLEATCISTGVAVYECSICGHIKTEETPINPDVHANLDYENGVVVTLPDCATDATGITNYPCLDCGEIAATVVYPFHEMNENVVPKTCTENGSYYAICTVCGYEESYVLEATGHYNYELTCGDTGACMECGVEFTMEHDFTWSPATCTEAAYCMNCWSYVGEPLGHKATYVEATEAYCHQAGNVAHWYCDQCFTAFEDEALTTELYDVVIPYTAEIVYVEAVEAACHQNGCAEYWYCSECEAVFADADLTQLTNRKNLTIPYTAEIVHVDAVEVACHQNGNVEYWYCAECQALFTDAALTQLSNFKSVVVPYTAEIVHVDAVEAACHQNGNVEYWYCAECQAVFTDVTLTQLSNFKSVVVPYTAEIVHSEAVAVTCTENGMLEFWYCAECNALFTDAALTMLSNYKSCVVPATGHVEGAEATCTTAQICTACKEVLVAALGHDYVEYVCSVCGKDDPDHYFEMSITDALAAADGKKVSVSGTVSVAEAWNSQYKNMSVTIVDADGNELYVYRLSTQVALGDIITVEGAMATYNGNRQIAQGATAVITGHDTSYDVIEEYTVAEAIALPDNTNVVVTGTVVKINTAYSSQYNNISVTIAGEDGTQLYIYRLVGNVSVNDVIKITGTITTYNGSKQINSGATFEAVGTHTCENFTEADCANPAICVVCGTVGTAALGHDYVDGVCSRCEKVDPNAGGEFTAVVPENLTFSGVANKASADSYMKSNYPGWVITGKLGQTYGGYLGFGRSGDGTSSIKSSEISINSSITIKTVLKGNGSNGVATSTLTFTLVDINGNVVATGYAEGATDAAIAPVDAKDTTYTISFVLEEGKTWTDVSNLVISFKKNTGNIGLKSLEFIV